MRYGDDLVEPVVLHASEVLEQVGQASMCTTGVERRVRGLPGPGRLAARARRGLAVDLLVAATGGLLTLAAVGLIMIMR